MYVSGPSKLYGNMGVTFTTEPYGSVLNYYFSIYNFELFYISNSDMEHIKKAEAFLYSTNVTSNQRVSR